MKKLILTSLMTVGIGVSSLAFADKIIEQAGAAGLANGALAAALQGIARNPGVSCELQAIMTSGALLGQALECNDSRCVESAVERTRYLQEALSQEPGESEWAAAAVVLPSCNLRK